MIVVKGEKKEKLKTCTLKGYELGIDYLVHRKGAIYDVIEEGLNWGSTVLVVMMLLFKFRYMMFAVAAHAYIFQCFVLVIIFFYNRAPTRMQGAL